MSASHNIVGCEATDRHRLIAFCQAHGAIVELPRRRRRATGFLLFAAGAIAGALILLLRP